MKRALSLDAEITEDGLHVDLPPELPLGRVVLTLELVPEEDDLELTDEDLQGLGLTAEEIAASPEIGAWAEDPEIPSGKEYVENLRRAPRYAW